MAALLFFSGLCALVYQTVWLRQFRLIFGASTFATGAVLAIFMGGLGIGSAMLGKRADLRERPLQFYGNLEILIAIAAALSQPLLWLAAKIYFASGGSPQLGIVVATLLRVFLATLVLGPATFLMGATLPAAARAVATDDDSGRQSVALLYGINTLGAVAGALLATFVMLETYGSHHTLILAVLVNVIVGVTARSMGRTGVVWASGLPSDSQSPRPEVGPRPALHGHVYLASALVGFAFLLMELVWYRMLSPILGGTTYMFGLILAVALFGIGVGGALYAMVRTERATAGAFAITCSLEALVIAIPFALGDRLAVLANVLRDLGLMGFGGHVAGWTLITVIVVFPAAVVAGYQFPLLIALLGQGRENVGRQIGAAYAWNTGGAIAGSLAGGFGILPLLTAPGTWRLVTILLTLLAVAAVVVAMRERDVTRSFATIAMGVAAIACIASMGPTAVWRHSGIGAARAPRPETRNDLQEWLRDTRRVLLWEKDGRESSIGVLAANDLVFFVNGKSDGAARGDAQTQIMSGLIGAILHPKPKNALVIGLGTGSTTGWLARVPGIEFVDTIELEPVVLDVARACAPVNAGAMTNPKVRVTIGDAREVLLTSKQKYDLVASEPSNPYRAGIASLFTHEYYEAAEERLAPGGLFMQWMQSYAIHTETMQTVYATLRSVFPYVQTWRTSAGDMLLVASREPQAFDAESLRARIAAEPYRTALHNAWRVDTLEQFLSHLVANEAFAAAAAEEAPSMNTDDRTVIEFGFARSLDERSAMMVAQISKEAEASGRNRPGILRGTVDWKLVDENRMQNLANATRPLNDGQLAEWALAMVETGDPRAQQLIDQLAQREPVEAAVLQAVMRFREKRYDEAVALLQRSFVAYRTNPWPHSPVMQRGISVAISLGDTSPARARQMYDALAQPFAVLVQDNYRRYALAELAPIFDGCGPKTIESLRGVEPDPFWTADVLQRRAVCYERAGLGELAENARRDLEKFRSAQATLITPPVRPGPRGSS